MTWLQVTAIYFTGMLATWLLWRANAMVGDWKQDLFTLCFWPVLVVVIAFVYINAWRKR